jgi:hypothetical protein
VVTLRVSVSGESWGSIVVCLLIDRERYPAALVSYHIVRVILVLIITRDHTCIDIYI